MILKKDFKTRFAPSPTGNLHVGHAYSALNAWKACGKNPKNFFLRIEDIDFNRCNLIYVDAIINDLKWLGIKWQKPIIFQSKRLKIYQSALKKLISEDLIYSCHLNKRDYEQILSEPDFKKRQIYLNISKNNTFSNKKPAWRMNIDKIAKKLGKIHWLDYEGKQHIVEYDAIGDFIIARRDIQTSYHLSSVIDDACSKISLVVRGKDLLESTGIHTILQKIFNFNSPIYFHHDLILDENGKKLSKKNKSKTISEIRKSGENVKNLKKLLFKKRS